MKRLTVRRRHEKRLALLRPHGVEPVICPSPDRVARLVGRCEAVITRDAGFSAAAIAAEPKLRVISAHATGRNAVDESAAAPGIRFDLGRQSRYTPTDPSVGWPEPLGEGTTLRRMLSGGGHDAAAGRNSTMIFVHERNGSHCPEERRNPATLAEAVATAQRAVLA